MSRGGRREERVSTVFLGFIVTMSSFRNEKRTPEVEEQKVFCLNTHTGGDDALVVGFCFAKKKEEQILKSK